MTAHDAFDEAVAAYALDALDASERALFEDHLASCDVCQRELTALRSVTAALGASVEPVAPPASLKARTLARAMAERPALAVPRILPMPVPAAPVRAGGSSLRWLAAAASFILIAGLAAYAAMLRSQVAVLQQAVSTASARAETLRLELTGLRRDSARLTNTVNVLSAPNLLKVDLRGQPGAPTATGRAYMSGGHGLVFSADHLPELPAGRVYQLWVIAQGQAPVSAGVFSVDASGMSAMAVALPATAQALRTVAVTVEPGPGGSPGPTTPILLVGSVGS